MTRFFQFLDLPWVQNCLVIAGFLLLAILLWKGSKNEQWIRAGKRLRKDRVGIVSLCVIGLYLLVGAMEMIQLPSKSGKRTIIDALTQKSRWRRATVRRSPRPRSRWPIPSR